MRWSDLSAGNPRSAGRRGSGSWPSRAHRQRGGHSRLGGGRRHPLCPGDLPRPHGRIAFTTIEYSSESNDEYKEIVSISPDVSAPRRLAREAEDPAYRPDGHMIAFDGPRGIFLMRSDGSAKRRLLYGPYGEPDWSPDGKRLLVTRMRGRRRIFLWSSGKLSALTRGAEPAWSPTGELIAFTRVHGLAPDGEFLVSVHVMRADGSRVRRLERGFDPEWSPNGRRVIFTRFDGSIRSIRPNRTGLRRSLQSKRSIPSTRRTGD